MHEIRNGMDSNIYQEGTCIEITNWPKALAPIYGLMTSKIPLAKLMEAESEKLLKMESRLKGRIVGNLKLYDVNVSRDVNYVFHSRRTS